MVYLPQLLPFVLGPLTECSDCVRTYMRWFAVLPGVLAAGAARADGLRLAITAAITLGILAVLIALGRDSAKAARWAAVVVVPLSAANALLFANLLRV